MLFAIIAKSTGKMRLAEDECLQHFPFSEPASGRVVGALGMGENKVLGGTS